MNLTSGLTPSLLATFLVAAAACAPAVAADCSVDTFTVDGRALTVTLCPSALKVAPDKTGLVSLAETIAGGGSSFTRTSELDFFAGETTSRSIEDVPLGKLGIEKSLHLTIGYKAGGVHIEHALLVPGAVPLK